MLACGAIGTLIGGRLADRFSRRVVLRTSLGVLTPLMVVMLSGGPGVAIVALAFIGAATIATFSVTVVMGQEYLPGRLGVASGVTLGLSIGVGGVAAAGLGALADATSLRTALEVVAVLPLPAVALALTLPEGRRPAAARTRASRASRFAYRRLVSAARLGRMPREPLIDGHGRRISDVRVSVTDRCNFRCQYCMPAEGLPVARPRRGPARSRRSCA